MESSNQIYHYFCFKIRCSILKINMYFIPFDCVWMENKRWIRKGWIRRSKKSALNLQYRRSIIFDFFFCFVELFLLSNEMEIIQFIEKKKMAKRKSIADLQSLAFVPWMQCNHQFNSSRVHRLHTSIALLIIYSETILKLKCKFKLAKFNYANNVFVWFSAIRHSLSSLEQNHSAHSQTTARFSIHFVMFIIVWQTKRFAFT